MEALGGSYCPCSSFSSPLETPASDPPELSSDRGRGKVMERDVEANLSAFIKSNEHRRINLSSGKTEFGHF